MDGFDISSAVEGFKDRVSSALERKLVETLLSSEIGAKPSGDNSAPAPAGLLPNFDLQNSAKAPIQLRPEQMVGTSRADDNTKQDVNRLVDDARKQGNRSIAASEFMQAINTANNSHDATLQALSKTEYGFANMNWGYASEAFRWICEAGSNNPSLYNPQQNQSFLQRLAQAGLPQAAVDLLLQNGRNDPDWYLRDPNALKSLEQAMTGPAYTGPGGDQSAQGRVTDPLAPPSSAPEQAINPNLGQPTQASGWFKDQINGALDSAAHNSDRKAAFGFYQQATDMADRCGDKMLESVTRVKTGLALISWGDPDDGFRWLLAAGSKNPDIYSDPSFQQFVKASGISGAAFDMYIGNGRQNANWYNGNEKQSAHSLAEALRKPSAAEANPSPESPVARPAISVPETLPPLPSPPSLVPHPSEFSVPLIPQLAPTVPDSAVHKEKNPFAS